MCIVAHALVNVNGTPKTCLFPQRERPTLADYVIGVS
jgi:hypothetical protein